MVRIQCGSEATRRRRGRGWGRVPELNLQEGRTPDPGHELGDILVDDQRLLGSSGRHIEQIYRVAESVEFHGLALVHELDEVRGEYHTLILETLVLVDCERKERDGQ